MEQENSSQQIKDTVKKKQIWMWILLGFITIIFIGAIVIFAGGWWVYKNKVDKNLDIVEDQEKYFGSDDWINDIDSYFIDEGELEDIVDETNSEPNIINGTQKFVSNEYGFILNFTENWDDYKAELIIDDVTGQDEYLLEVDGNINEEDNNQLQKGFKAAYIFYYPTNDENIFTATVDGYIDSFVVDIYELDEYQAIKNGEVTEIGRNNKYIFTYTNYFIPRPPSEVAPPRDILQEALYDINTIAEGIETFNVRVLE